MGSLAAKAPSRSRGSFSNAVSQTRLGPGLGKNRILSAIAVNSLTAPSRFLKALDESQEVGMIVLHVTHCFAVLRIGRYTEANGVQLTCRSECCSRMDFLHLSCMSTWLKENSKKQWLNPLTTDN